MNTSSTDLKSLVLSDHEIRILNQSVSASIKDVVESKAKTAELVTNKDAGEHILQFFCDRHAALININKKLFGLM